MKENIEQAGIRSLLCCCFFVDGRSEVGVHATHQPSHRKSTSDINGFVQDAKQMYMYIYNIQYIRGISLSFFQKSLHVTIPDI